VLYPAIKSGADLTKNPIPIMNNPTIKLSISIVCQFFIIVANARLYAVGRGISANYESFWPSGCDWGERNLQYAVEHRLPYHSFVGISYLFFLVFP
jgi:hypothetical protein